LLGLLERKPIRRMIKEYRPILPRRKWLAEVLGRLGLNPFPEEIRVDRTITFDEAVELIRKTAWARGLAEGMATKLLEYTPSSAGWHTAVERISRRVAEGLARTIVT